MDHLFLKYGCFAVCNTQTDKQNMETAYTIVLPYELASAIVDPSLSIIIDQFSKHSRLEDYEYEHE